MSKIVLKASDTVCESMRRRPPVKEVVARKMKQAERNPYAIERAAAEKGLKITPGGVRQIVTGSTANPGIYTLEALATGLGIKPMQLISEILGENLKEANAKPSLFQKHSEIYQDLSSTQKAKADIYVEALQFLLERLKNPQK